MNSGGMEKRVFATALGPVPVWGMLDGFSPERRLVLVIRGAFAQLNVLHGLTDDLPEADLAYVHLPGMHTPFFAHDSVEDFAAAFDEVLSTLGHRRVVVIGLSLGGTVAMAMRSVALQTLLLIDTPLSTEPMWMLPPILRPMVRNNQRGARWVWDLLGISQTEVVNRDYRPLLARLTVTTGVLLASDPLGEARPVARDPSAVSEEDRALYRTHPLVSVRTVADTGHQIGRDGSAVVLQTLRRLVGP